MGEQERAAGHAEARVAHAVLGLASRPTIVQRAGIPFAGILALYGYHAARILLGGSLGHALYSGVRLGAYRLINVAVVR